MSIVKREWSKTMKNSWNLLVSTFLAVTCDITGPSPSQELLIPNLHDSASFIYILVHGIILELTHTISHGSLGPKTFMFHLLACVFASGVILLAFRFFIVPLGYLSLPYLCQLSMDLLHSFSRVHDYYSRHYCFFRIFYFRRGTVLYW